MREIRRLLLARGLAASTKQRYNRDVKLWLDWNLDQLDDPLFIDADKAADFIAFCFSTTNKNGASIRKVMTAIFSYMTDNGYDYDEISKHRTIRRMLKGFVKIKPPNRRKKMPFSKDHLHHIFKFGFDPTVYDEYMAATAVLFGYYGGLRPGEYTKTTNNKDNPLLIKNIEWIPNKKDPFSIIINIFKSKTNKLSILPESISIDCSCRFYNGYIPCIVHRLLKYFKIRRKKVGSFKKHDPLFINGNGTILGYQHINNFMYNIIGNIADGLDIDMDPKKYTPHTLRSGRCTDMAREGVPGVRIQKWGRWKSLCWMDHYLNLDWKDIAKITRRSIHSLQANITAETFQLEAGRR